MNNITDQHRDWACSLAMYLAKKDSEDATQISHKAVALWNAVGEVKFKKLIMFYMRQILLGINGSYPGQNILNEGIHPMKRKFIRAMYDRLVRDRVMPEIYKYMFQNIEPGAFAHVLTVAEDFPRLRGVVTEDKSVRTENHLRELIASIKRRHGAVDEIVRALARDNFGDLDEPGEEDSPGSDSEEELHGFVADENPLFYRANALQNIPGFQNVVAHVNDDIESGEALGDELQEGVLEDRVNRQGDRIEWENDEMDIEDEDSSSSSEEPASPPIKNLHRRRALYPPPNIKKHRREANRRPPSNRIARRRALNMSNSNSE